jgi:methylmalonyl-CoA mutase cobalamin-binding domain/chain
MSQESEITQLETEALIERMQDDLYDGLADEVVAGVQELLRREMTPYDILTRALVGGMDIVGADFRDGVLFVPEVLMAAKAMKGGMALLRPLLAETGAPPIGTMVIGTVKGDIHDIGKNLVAMMMEGGGFKVVNLGINVDSDAFLAAVREHKPDIVGLSALLTTTMPYMGVVIKALKEAAMRDDLIVLVGGAPLNDAFAEEVEADAYCRDAAVAVEKAKKLKAIKASRN